MSRIDQLAEAVCAECGSNLFRVNWTTQQPAAGPWNYDMSAAPDGNILLLCSPVGREQYCCVAPARASDGTLPSMYTAWAAINLPEATDDH